jgi:hypothetical protein
MIAPFNNDLPVSNSAGFRRVCDDHNYAYFGSNQLKTQYLMALSCQLVALPEPSYRTIGAYIMSKNSSHRGLISWR